MSHEHRSEQYTKKAVPVSLTRKVLRREQRKMLDRCFEAFPPRPEMSVLDLGVNTSLSERKDYFFENGYPYPNRVTAVAVEPARDFSKLFPECTFVQTRRDDSRLPFEDQSFDLVFCNAVVEHVGSRDKQRAFVQEVLRLGKAVFLTTPNRWYPVELHTVTPLLHWLPASVYRPVYRRLGFDFFAREENLNLLTAPELRACFVGSAHRVTIERHHFLGLASNLLAIARLGPT